jgi:hypothetical protein
MLRSICSPWGFTNVRWFRFRTVHIDTKHGRNGGLVVIFPVLVSQSAGESVVSIGMNLPTDLLTVLPSNIGFGGNKQWQEP